MLIYIIILDSLVYHINTTEFYNDLKNNINLLDRMDTTKTILVLFQREKRSQDCFPMRPMGL